MTLRFTKWSWPLFCHLNNECHTFIRSIYIWVCSAHLRYLLRWYICVWVNWSYFWFDLNAPTCLQALTTNKLVDILIMLHRILSKCIYYKWVRLVMGWVYIPKGQFINLIDSVVAFYRKIYNLLDRKMFSRHRLESFFFDVQ